MKVSQLKPNPDNPRVIKDEDFYRLCKSIQEFPKMMALRPIVTDEDMMVLGGNQRLKALQHLGMKEIPDEWVKKASELTAEEREKFIMLDNISAGDWSAEKMNDWQKDIATEWGEEINWDEKIDKMEEGEEIEVEKSVQIQPPKEYILIMAEPNSVEWEELKETLKLKMVRRGGYKKGSAFDAVGLERVIEWKDFKKRLNADSSTK